MTDKQCIEKALLKMYLPCNNQSYGDPFWVHVANLFGMERDNAVKLCVKHGFDPEKRVYKVLRGKP